jgi:hypothetical protein
MTGYQLNLHESITQKIPHLDTAQNFQYYQFLIQPSILKILCYADDTLVFIQSITDLNRLQLHIHTYCEASNAKINFDKVQALSLSGKNTWNYWGLALTAINISTLHYEDDPSPLIYLGSTTAEFHDQLPGQTTDSFHSAFSSIPICSW